MECDETDRPSPAGEEYPDSAPSKLEIQGKMLKSTDLHSHAMLTLVLFRKSKDRRASLDP